MDDRVKEPYEKPAMVTEKIDVAKLVGQGSPGGQLNPIPQAQPFFGLCCD